ncbi:protein TnpA [gamma proteobacterium BDW918]|jgi:TnpA family transposase|uniref:Tn3 family transposase n=2 Tax=Pseudomonadota TaxID=1224 RepID=UPI00025C1828|nr:MULTISPECIES: Tn3 family transposase [Cellvibrionales]EIF42700.1 protein TnpA [gamma proteobacterium BDW918]MAT94291.1 Tn3 family transposase [Halioglobus sp.]MAT94785.1 Tn3 family transposase [Halioglobus sp.]MBP52955.1 Tn3 family transposase [Marinobacter sp.]|tara:strand:- start:122 stop:3142 length:3021 start_codon:yes stop_codon:yes gene_type:complete
MAYEERVQILSDAEQDDFYGPPIFTSNDQRFIFALNDKELAVANKFRNRGQRYMFIVLLGYFKAKPVVLNPGFHQIKHDLKHVHETVLPGPGFRPFNLSQKENERIYKRIFELCEYQRWSFKAHGSALVAHLTQQAKAWSAPRHLFDAAIEYLSGQKIAIPAYSTLQKIISQVVGQEQDRLITHVDLELPQELKDALAALVNVDGSLTLRQLRQSARNFTGTELEKELTVHRHIQHWMSQVNAILSTLSLSQKNQQHFAERVDYYGAKLKRQSVGNQRLYLLCYLQFRWQQALERIADGFVHHVRQAKNKSKAYAQEVVYQDWQKAAKNVSKAAEVLHLFIDDSIDQQQPFGAVRQKALKLLAEKDLKSVYLFLNEQKRSVEEAMWQYYDQRDSLREGLLRQLFLCLRYEASAGAQRLAAALNHARLDLAAQGVISNATIDARLPSKKQLPFLQDEGGTFNPDRYEWYLYLQIPDRLNGQLTLPDVIKYRALDADLVSRERWRREKHNLLEQTQLPKLTAEPSKLIERTANDLEIRLYEVSDYLEQDDNRNIILRNPKGKRLWRLPTGSKKYLVNNPFFQQIPTTGVADVLRMVDRDTGFIECFEHVLGAQSKNRAHEYDLLAILVGNATNQGIYGMAQISDRTYDQLSTIQANYLRLETLNAANDNINNATAMLPIFKHYNIQEDIIHASADGQKFEARRETFKTRYSSKYFGTQKGVSAMSLIANHAAINARVIGANEHESHYIFDLLMNNSSEIIPDVLSTDTHGVNHVNFALLDLFGYSFAPRYAQVSRVINEMFDVKEDKDQRIQLRLKKAINTKRIMQHWDTIQRIAVSLKERKTTQATLVRKLSGYKKNHPLLEALTEYNRLVKANYLLNYIDDASLRNYVQRALNRGEAYHQLRRAISNVNGDQFRGSSDEEIQLWNECARLVTNAIIYFNSSILSQLLTSFEYQNDDKRIQIVKQASPVAWYNINLKGIYTFEMSEKLPDLEELMRTIEGYLPVREK